VPLITTAGFLRYLGLASLAELPPLSAATQALPISST
jgi:chromosome segregation and condensation protein ScpB